MSLAWRYVNDRLLHKPLIEARNWQIKVTFVESLSAIDFTLHTSAEE